MYFPLRGDFWINRTRTGHFLKLLFLETTKRNRLLKSCHCLPSSVPHSALKSLQCSDLGKAPNSNCCCCCQGKRQGFAASTASEEGSASSKPAASMCCSNHSLLAAARVVQSAPPEIWTASCRADLGDPMDSSRSSASPASNALQMRRRSACHVSLCVTPTASASPSHTVLAVGPPAMSCRN